jgi:hypothetical protein
LVQNFVEITQGSITSEPFDEEIETSITIRRVRSGLLTLVCQQTAGPLGPVIKKF